MPLFVTTFITEPAARPNSAANWLVMSRISWTMSVLLIGCWRPVTLGSLLSWPSIMMLFDRSRAPFDEKFASTRAGGEVVLAAGKLAHAGRRPREREDVPAADDRQLGDARRVEPDADLGVRGVDDRRIGAHLDDFGDGRGPELDVDDGGLVQCQGEAGADVPREPGQLHAHLVVADGHVEEPVDTVCISDHRSTHVRVHVPHRHGGAGNARPWLSRTTPWIVPVVDWAATEPAHRTSASRPSPTRRAIAVVLMVLSLLGTDTPKSGSRTYHLGTNGGEDFGGGVGWSGSSAWTRPPRNNQTVTAIITRRLTVKTRQLVQGHRQSTQKNGSQKSQCSSRRRLASPSGQSRIKYLSAPRLCFAG